MKNNFFMVCILCSFFIQAQEKNHISIDPFLPVFGTIQVQYERALNKNMSLGISVGLKVASGIFELQGIETNKVIINDFNFKGFKIIPEYRWYIQNQGLSGFYVGSYVKYQDFTEGINGIYIDNDMQNSDIDLDGKIKTIAIGLEIGYKLVFAKHFFFDFIIAGPGTSFNVFELKENAPIPQAFYDDLSEAVSNYGVFEQLDISIEIDANTKSEVIALPAFRYGIKFGYRF